MDPHSGPLWNWACTTIKPKLWRGYRDRFGEKLAEGPNRAPLFQVETYQHIAAVAGLDLSCVDADAAMGFAAAIDAAAEAHAAGLESEREMQRVMRVRPSEVT